MATIDEKPGTVSWILGNMPFVAIIEGGFLVLFGIVAYIYSGQTSITALIPSIFGLGILNGEYSLANISKGVLLIICGEYLYFCILSFRAARIKREQEALQQ